MKTFLIIIGVIFALWLLWSIFGSSVEQLKFQVVEERDGYEIRKYEDHLIAKVSLPVTGRKALNQGFTKLAGYIFGDTENNEKIAMTAPVMAKDEKEKSDIAFTMPSKYTKETLPKPKNSEIIIEEVKGKTYAAKKFTWLYTEERIEAKKQELLSELERDNIKTNGAPIFAGYNAPWTIPFLIRNEILVEIEDKK